MVNLNLQICPLYQDYLPKMSIPVEKRDLGDGWVLTCRGEDGGDLTLSDVNIKRENLICQGMWELLIPSRVFISFLILTICVPCFSHGRRYNILPNAWRRRRR